MSKDALCFGLIWHIAEIFTISSYSNVRDLSDRISATLDAQRMQADVVFAHETLRKGKLMTNKRDYR